MRRVLAEQSGVPVLAISYRLAPEHKLPTAHDDAYAAFRWVHEHAEELGADPSRIAVGVATRPAATSPPG